jgi:hypothetical protein
LPSGCFKEGFRLANAGQTLAPLPKAAFGLLLLATFVLCGCIGGQSNPAAPPAVGWASADATTLSVSVPANGFVWQSVMLQEGSANVTPGEQATHGVEAVATFDQPHGAGTIFFSRPLIVETARQPPGGKEEGIAGQSEWVATAVEPDTTEIRARPLRPHEWTGSPRALLLLAGGTIPFNVSVTYRLPASVGPILSGPAKPLLSVLEVPVEPNGTDPEHPYHSELLLGNLTTQGFVILGFKGAPLEDHDGPGVLITTDFGCGERYDSQGSGGIRPTATLDPPPNGPLELYSIRSLQICRPGEVAGFASMTMDSATPDLSPFAFAAPYDPWDSWEGQLG